MQTILEIFYVRIVGNMVRYQRKQANLSQRGSNPDRMIQAFIREKRQDESGKAEEKEFIVHSTSWRYARPGKVILTYVAYSDALEFQKGKSHGVSIKRLRTITKTSRPPRSKRALEKQVVSHAMRHIAFLIQTDSQSDYKSALKPDTKKVFQKLWVSLAGKVY
jgi:hypothetical protein